MSQDTNWPRTANFQPRRAMLASGLPRPVRLVRPRDAISGLALKQ